ncbi:MAG: hypothetical protein ACOY45_10070 [Pseudomonadota bacterium]
MPDFADGDADADADADGDGDGGEAVSIADDRASAAFGRRFCIEMAVHPIAVDDVCAHAAGPVAVTMDGNATGGRSVFARVAVLNRRVAYLFRFLPGNREDVATHQLRPLRDCVPAIRHVG